ncbi:MAG: helix-turn-helix transcriptional regulator [Candidatus Dormibacteraeota bacterium]|uniref:Helix-turn-helix transcriptional regulator n=1 Tax=Candidatus Aeolococcus gillhamiae TaxID=3127015 RepID=A0A934K0Y4_9BACT|nr:helix-turn-helix transcriptional regulator [Candidatus Dormibacteraeota bacterium]
MSDPSEKTGNPPPPAWDSLSSREQQVLTWMMAGLGADEIAETLGTTVATVRTQIRGVLAKLGVHSQREATSLAFRSRWAPKQRP